MSIPWSGSSQHLLETELERTQVPTLGVIVQNPSAGYITLDICTGVTVHGPVTLTAPLSVYPYAQGTFLAVDNVNRKFTVQVSLPSRDDMQAFDPPDMLCLTCSLENLSSP